MGHSIEMRTYPENVNKQKVKADWDNFVAHECWQEGATGLYRPIRWIDQFIAENREEAEQFIMQHDRGNYDQLAVRFKVNKDTQEILKKTKLLKTYQDIWERLQKEKEKLQKASSELRSQKVTSEFVTCKNCGSKLANKFLKSNRCPVCNTDLRSATELQRIATYRENVNKYQAQLDDLEKKALARNNKNVVLNWLVKIEYHT